MIETDDSWGNNTYYYISKEYLVDLEPGTSTIPWLSPPLGSDRQIRYPDMSGFLFLYELLQLKHEISKEIHIYSIYI
jgi:hypothetical protein